VVRAVKDLYKLKEERDAREQDVRLAAERDITHLRESSADLLAACSDLKSAHSFFSVVDRIELEANEFNLNVSRYVDTFDDDKYVALDKARAQLTAAETTRAAVMTRLWNHLNALGAKNAI
jgi:type I restriction enzyme M protein